MSSRHIRTPLVTFVLGTRPEAIKLAPVIRAFAAEPTLETKVCVTAQHRELLDRCLEFFRLRSDVDLDLMVPDQPLPALTAKTVAGCAAAFEQSRPDLVCVQGDTTSAFAAALAASLCKIPVAHVEAGLRSHRRCSPFPEENNRVLISHLAELHFAPGQIAAENLRREGVTEGVHVVGNTVVDALGLVLRTIADDGDAPYRKRFPEAASSEHKTLLVTLHRRENFGRPLANVCGAVRRLAETCPELRVLFPVHPNPRVRDVVYKHLSGTENVRLLEPLSYPDFVWLLSCATLVLSDSGGVLEEAETLGRPVLIAREVTERTEALDAGNARLVGSDPACIVAEARRLLDAAAPASGPVGPVRPWRHTFGDGQASARILRLTREHLAATRPERSSDRPEVTP